MTRRAGLALCACCLATGLAAQGKAPAPEFAVKFSFEEAVARLFARDCPGISFDHDGFDRHVLALMAEYSDRGHHARSFAKNFAPIQLERYGPYFEKLAAKYDLTPDSTEAEWCDAGEAEAAWRTPIGQMLKVEQP